MIGAGSQPTEVLRFLRSVSQLKEPEAGLGGLAGGFQLAGVKSLRVPGADAVLLRLVDSSSAPVEAAAWEVARSLELSTLIQQAEARAFSPDLPVNRRALAVGALGGGQYASVRPALEKVLSTFQPAELQVAAIGSLAAFDDPGVASILITHWKAYAPAARAKTVDALLSRTERAEALMNALEDGRIERADIDVAARPRLLEHPNQEIAQRAARLFQAGAGDRRQVVESYRAALELTGEADRGRELFEEHCARCHLPGRELARVGPNLSGISNKTKEELLTSILDPSYAIEARYVNYLVTTKDGHLHDGILANETPGSITLRNGSDDGDQTILREDIGEVRASSISAMPDELEKSIDHQGMADVIAYLRGGL
ncbi:MAG: c-type cytochrome [bacterium]|nr:c-type cytochrome [bacterium]